MFKPLNFDLVGVRENPAPLALKLKVVAIFNYDYLITFDDC